MTILKFFIFATLISLGWFYYQTASIVNFLSAGIMLAAAIAMPIQLYHAYKTGFHYEHLRSPFQSAQLKYWLSILNKWLALTLAWIAVRIAMVKLQYTESGFAKEMAMITTCIVVLAICAFFVRQRIDRSFNLLILLLTFSLSFELYQVKSPPPLEESVVLNAPFAGSFYVIDGGNSRLNSTMKIKARITRRHAIYLVAAEGHHAPKTSPEGYEHTFGETILAPANGTVLQIADGVVDSLPDNFSNDGGPGNFIYIKIGESKYLIIAHLKNGSFLVSEGDTVITGQPIAQAGKSGSVTIPAVFMAVHTMEDLFSPDNRSYPIYFDKVIKHNDPAASAPFFVNRNDLYQKID